MRSLEQIACELLACVATWEPTARPVGNVTALELAALACSRIVTCPSCGSEASTNIDCATCAFMSGIESLSEPAPPMRGRGMKSNAPPGPETTTFNCQVALVETDEGKDEIRLTVADGEKTIVDLERSDRHRRAKPGGEAMIHHDLRIRLLAPRAKVPSYGSASASGLDLYALDDVTLRSDAVVKVPTGIAVEIPDGYEGQVRGRSGLSSRGIFVELGTIDSDYRGEVCVLMHAQEEVDICAGDRIAQLVIVPVERVRPVVVAELSETQRGDGGFGSTGR